ncbi:hypothetical protein ACTXT7_006921 [Hymenolepis weldensis]
MVYWPYVAPLRPDYLISRHCNEKDRLKSSTTCSSVHSILLLYKANRIMSWLWYIDLDFDRSKPAWSAHILLKCVATLLPSLSPD